MRIGLTLLCFFNDTATTEIYTLTHSFPTRRSSDLQPCSSSPISVRLASADSVVLPVPERPKKTALLPSGPTLAEQCIGIPPRSEEHTSELQSLMRLSYAVFCLKKKNLPPAIPNLPALLHIGVQHVLTPLTNEHIV